MLRNWMGEHGPNIFLSYINFQKVASDNRDAKKAGEYNGRKITKTWKLVCVNQCINNVDSTELTIIPLDFTSKRKNSQ